MKKFKEIDNKAIFNYAYTVLEAYASLYNLLSQAPEHFCCVVHIERKFGKQSEFIFESSINYPLMGPEEIFCEIREMSEQESEKVDNEQIADILNNEKMVEILKSFGDDLVLTSKQMSRRKASDIVCGVCTHMYQLPWPEWEKEHSCPNCGHVDKKSNNTL